MTSRRGLTLVEILVAMTLTLAVFAITLPFVRAQTRALGSNAGRLDADQIARYAQRRVDRDLRLAAGDPGQPTVVYAGTMGVSFNANLLAADTSDPNAFEVEAGADSSLTEAWRVSDAATLPLTARSYPTEDYVGADGVMSRVETISYFLHPDTVSGRSDIYVLYRRVNARDSTLVVRGIQVPQDSAFFSYFVSDADTLLPIAASALPLYWDSTATPSIRAVGIRSSGFFRNTTDAEDVIRTVRWRTLFTNTTASVADCGAAPGDPSAVSHSTQTSTGSSNYHVRVTWNRSGDDGTGDDDVTHYIVWIRYNVNPVTWTRVATVPARDAATYRYDHYLPRLVGQVRYGVSAVDCGGSESSKASHNSNLNLQPG
jgi:Tfp pilus assembly protein PilW